MILFRNAKFLAHLVIFFAQVMLFPYCVEAAFLDGSKVETKFLDSDPVLVVTIDKNVSRDFSFVCDAFESGQFFNECVSESGGCNGEPGFFISPVSQPIRNNSAGQKEASSDQGDDEWSLYFYALLPIFMGFASGLFWAPKTNPWGGLDPNVPMSGAEASAPLAG